MRVRITQVLTAIPQGHYIQWVLDSAPPSAPVTFTVERAGGPDGPWTTILPPTCGQYAVLDDFSAQANTDAYNPPNLLHVYDRFYYRVTANAPGVVPACDVTETGPREDITPRAGRMAQERKRLRYNFEKTLQSNGTPCVLLKRRTWGPRCKRCTDTVLKQNMRGDCRDCWGTTYVGGYWTPWYTAARRNVTTNTTSVTPEGKSDTSDAKFWLPIFPQLERDDVIVTLSDNRRYRVDQQLQTEIRLQGVHQVLSCQELAHDHVIYHLLLEPRAIGALT